MKALAEKDSAVAIDCHVDRLRIDVRSVRAQFPAFKECPETVFFDNAATTQKPSTVIGTVTDFYTRECANAGRGSYARSTSLTSRIEEARARVAGFLGADSDDVGFTEGATRSLNTVALAWGLNNLRSGDEIMLCPEDHKSTVFPWFNLKRLLGSFGVQIKVVPIRIHPEGDYDLNSIREGRTDRTRLVAVTHGHHVYGLDMEVDQVRRIVGDDVLISLDASQSVGHRTVNVSQLPVEFLSFSGHKMFAANGIGVLWASPKVRPSLRPVTVGGGMTPKYAARDFRLRGSSLASIIEAGTQNIPSILSMVPAINFIETLGVEAIEVQLRRLTKSLYDGLKELPGIDFSPGVDRCSCHRGTGIVSFRFEQVATSDLVFLFESANILVRTGDHCLSSSRLGDFYARVSLHVYNTVEEIDLLIHLLRQHLC